MLVDSAPLLSVLHGCSHSKPAFRFWGSLRSRQCAHTGSVQQEQGVQVLGTPSKDDILGMNPNYNEFRFPQIKSHPWSKVFDSTIEQEAIDLISGLLRYSPHQRLSGVEAMAHPFFAEILKPDCKLPNGAALTLHDVFVACDCSCACDRPLIQRRCRAGQPLPPLTNWLPGELHGTKPEVLRQLGVSSKDPAVTEVLPKPARV